MLRSSSRLGLGIALAALVASAALGQTPGLPPVPVGLPPTGAAGGDLSGTYPNPSIKSGVGLTNPTIGAGSAITSSGPGGALASGAYASAYSLPTATASVLGGVKPDGTTITNTAGVISVSPPYLAVHLANSTAFGSAGPIIIPYDVVDQDNKSWFNATTHLYTPLLAGKYLVTCPLVVTGTFILNNAANALAAKNGTSVITSVGQAGGAESAVGTSISWIVSVNGSTDTLSCQAFSSATSPTWQGVAGGNIYNSMVITWAGQ